MAHKTMLLPCLLLLQCLQHFEPNYAKASNVTSIIVFGDSSVDTGNNNQIMTIAKSDFQPYGRDFQGGRPTGRFCNGRLATDFISEALGLKPTIPAYLDPAYNINDFATGVCFASAATGYDNATSNVLNVIPLWKQLEYFKAYRQDLRNHMGEQNANHTLAEAMYIISLGTNDFLENYYTLSGGRSRRRYKIGEYEDFLAGIAENFVTKIYNLGARKISLGGVPPMGCMPLERAMSDSTEGSECVDEYNKVAMDFNAKIRALVAKLRAQLLGIKLVFSDVYPTMFQIIQNPSEYGFENVAVGCCATGIFEMGYLCDRYNPFTCKNASKYFFWDAFHPTERVNQIVADHVMKTSFAEFL